MTVEELMEKLAELDPELEVVMLTQPNYPIVYEIMDVKRFNGRLYLMENVSGETWYGPNLWEG